MNRQAPNLAWCSKQIDDFNEEAPSGTYRNAMARSQYGSDMGFNNQKHPVPMRPDSDRSEHASWARSKGSGIYVGDLVSMRSDRFADKVNPHVSAF